MNTKTNKITVYDVIKKLQEFNGNCEVMINNQTPIKQIYHTTWAVDNGEKIDVVVIE